MFPTLFRSALLMLTLLPAAASAEMLSLTITVTEAEPATGTIEISLFDSDETFLKNPRTQQACTPAEDGSCTVGFAALDEGEYAVVVVHDANDNQKLDNGFLGFGAESFAYSNGAKNPIFGHASFGDAKITVNESMEIEISLD